MYPGECAKSVALTSKVRSMEESAAVASGSYKSTYEVALPFPCQEQFTPIQTRVAEHPGIEFLKLYHDEKQTWVYMLHLEMTDLQSSYQVGVKVIPTRVIESKKAATISFKPPTTPTSSELSDFLSHLTSVLVGRSGNVHYADGATQNGQEQSTRKRTCPTGDDNPTTPAVPEFRDDAEQSLDHNV